MVSMVVESFLFVLPLFIRPFSFIIFIKARQMTVDTLTHLPELYVDTL